MQRIGVWLTAGLAVLALVVGGLVVMPVSATIQVICKGVSKADVNACDPGYAPVMAKMHWRMYGGHNCTNFVAYQLGANGVPEPKILMGNARDWTANAKKLDYKVNTTPAVGSVGTWPGRNHVTYVAEVGDGYIVTREDNYPGYYPKGIYQKLKIYESDSSYPKNFIHFKDLVSGTVPTISGAKQVGETLKAATGKWAPSGVTLSYQWRRDGVALSGKTKAKYAVAADDLGHAMSVKVTGKKAGLAPATKTSAKTAKVIAGVLDNSTAPAISGTTKVGETLTASAGSWTPGGVGFDYEWRRNGVALAGATAPTYTLTPEDLGTKISAEVTGTKDGYNTLIRPIAPTKAIAAGTLDNPDAPSISGTSKVGEPLTASDGTWSPADATLTRKWLVDGIAIKGETGTIYQPVAKDLGKVISVKVTATRSAYTTRSVTSAATTVTPGTLANTAAPAITGTVGVGKTLTASDGTWAPIPSGFTYQWFADGVELAGAIKATFVPNSAELGKGLTVRVTATKTAYAPADKTSAPTGPVAEGTLTNTKAPSVSGKALVGSTLKASPGSWTPSGVTFTYRWLRDDDVAIEGATRESYKITTADRGAKISVEVTGVKHDYTSVTAVSKKTAPVKSTPKIAVKAKPGKAKVAFAVTVTATGEVPTGQVKIYDGKKKVKTVKLKDGKAKVTLTKRTKGKHSFSFRYMGDTAVAGRLVTKKATIR